MEQQPPFQKKKRPLTMVSEMEQGMPRSDSAEEGVLSCFLQNPKELLGNFQEIGRREWFHHAGNRLIFTELMMMFDEGEVPIDPVTFAQHLIDRKAIEKIGGPAKIAELLNFVPTPAHYIYYLDILRSKFLLRETIRNAEEIKQKTYEGEEGIKAQAESIVENASVIISLFDEREKPKTMAEHVEDTMREWQDIAEGKVRSSKALRWTQWNMRLGGLRKAYYLLKAKRGMGKSSFALDVALQTSVTATDKEPSIIASYEMSHAKIIKRAISNIAEVDNKYVTDPDLHKPSEEIRKKITRAAARIASSPLYVIYEPGLTITGIEHRARKIRPSFMAIDYLQRMPLPKGYTPKELPAAYGSLSRSVFDLRNELDNTVMVLSHVNNDGEASYSMALENDADIGLLIENDGIRVTKNRDGQDGMELDMELDGTTFRFDTPKRVP